MCAEAAVVRCGTAAAHTLKRPHRLWRACALHSGLCEKADLHVEHRIFEDSTMATHTSEIPPAEPPRVGDVIHHITEDVKTIARDELELVQLELQRTIKNAAIDGSVILLGGIVALIGLGLLCVAAVDALGYIIPWLWLRLIIMALVYMMMGGILAAAFADRLKHNAKPDFSPAADEAKRTVQHVKHGLRG
jgi:hypothetical protein